MKNKFEFFDHTADLGLKVWSPDLTGIFSTAAQGMFSVITDLKKIVPRLGFNVSLHGDRDSDLLIHWLNHLNYLFAAEEMLFSEFNILSLRDGQLQALIRGEKFLPDKHEIFGEIKAVTYHQLILEKQRTGWYAQLIFDL